MPGRQDLRAAFHVLAARPGVRAASEPARKPDCGVLAQDIFFKNHGIDPLGQQRPGEDPDRAPRRNRSRKGSTGRRPTLGERQDMRTGAQGRVGESVAIDGGIRSRRMRSPGHEGFRQYPAARRGERQRLGFGDGIQPLAQPRQRLVHRHPVHPRRHGEAIVAQMRHRRPRGGPQCSFVADPEDPALLPRDDPPVRVWQIRREERGQISGRI